MALGPAFLSVANTLYWLLFCCHDKNPISKTIIMTKEFIWLRFPDREPILGWGGILTAGSRRGKLRADIPHHKHKAGKENWKWGEAMNCHSLPQWCFSSSKATRPPQMPSPTGDQVFKYLSIWGTFLIQTITSLEQRTEE